MKQLLALSLILLSPAVAFAQSSGEPAKKPAEKTAKAPAKKTETTSWTQLQSATNQVAAGIRAADVALTPAELAIADRVYTGNIACELGASVAVDADPKSPGYFTVKGKGFAYRMHPVVTSTGAIRLEDHHDGGAVWLQLPNKSMRMDQKHGKRLADECANPTQLAAAEALKKNPPPVLIDTSTPAGCGKAKC